jgi:hypothetical protein
MAGVSPDVREQSIAQVLGSDAPCTWRRRTRDYDAVER